MALRYDGRVALITGAGGGLGRIYALEFAARGAAIVVNDLGGDMTGGGKSSRPADCVVEEIRAAGGKAVANYDSVEDGEKLVQAALDNFGRLDILVNNAGVLRDKSFSRLSNQDWDIVHRVHLRGSFLVTRAAWEQMKKQNFGRIIMVSSPAGIYGNFGQANYSAAKLGLLGLGNTLAIEGQKYNIRCNTVAPTAASRMLATVMPEEMLSMLKPEYIAPLVLYLCHEGCTETGGLYEIAAGWISKVRWQKSKGAIVVKKAAAMTPEQVRDSWSQIVDFSNPVYHTSTKEQAEVITEVLQHIESGTEASWSAPSASKSASAVTQPAETAEVFPYSDTEVVTYALGVGASVSTGSDLRFLFEGSDDFCVLPTFAVRPALAATSQVIGSGEVQGVQVELSRVLHGEQYLEVFGPLPTSGTLTSKATVVDVLDKGSGACIIVNVDTFDEGGKKVAFNQVSTFVVGSGGFGGKRQSEKAIASLPTPNRAPDAIVKQQTTRDQAALYRLSGDRNPLHIDPSFAALGGFKEPILHGLCSFGFSARHILAQYAGNDVKKFKAIKARFVKPVIPGQTLQTNMWKEGKRIFFETKVVETGETCLAGGYVDLALEEGVAASGPAPQASAPQASAAQSNTGAPSGLLSSKLFGELSQRLSKRTDLATKVGAIFQFDVTSNGALAGQWTVDLKQCKIYQGTPIGEKAACTLTLDDADLVDLAAGKLNAQKAFMAGKLKAKGNIMLSQKLALLFQDQAKL